MTLASQGAWKFIAADLIHDSATEHSFVHGLESFFYVLLYLCILYLPSTWNQDQRSDFVNTLLGPRSYEGSHALGKSDFMSNSDPWLGLAFTSNVRLTRLIYRLKEALSKRYIDRSDPEKAIRVPSFMSKEEYDSLEFTHNDMIQLFTEALESSDWPKSDRSESRLTVPSNSFEAFIGYAASSGSSSKRLSSGSVM